MCPKSVWSGYRTGGGGTAISRCGFRVPSDDHKSDKYVDGGYFDGVPAMTMFQFAVIGAVVGVGIHLVAFCAAVVSGAGGRLGLKSTAIWTAFGGLIGLVLGWVWNL